MNIKEIGEILKRKATIFETGGRKPSYELLESWIGYVGWSQIGEQVPNDLEGNKMEPIATLFLKDLMYIPKELSSIELITVFMSPKVFKHLCENDLGNWFKIRSYKTLDGLERCEWKANIIRPFPLIPKTVENDYPTWDNGGIPDDIFDEILKLEDEKDYDYFDDIVEEMYGKHKLGGYPTFCQSGYWFGDGYEFVMQIASDEKARFNIVDNGNFYFFYNQEKDNWKIYCDFY